MRPPVQFTSDPNTDWIVLIVAAILLVYWVRALRLAREGARIFLQNLAVAALVFIFFRLALSSTRIPQNDAIGIAGFIALVVFFFRKATTRRSRYIPKSVKRAVIERDLKGERYDPAKHHIDHRWPFAKGGSHSIDNLRVIAKRKNLQKGAKRPRIWEMW